MTHRGCCLFEGALSCSWEEDRRLSNQQLEYRLLEGTEVVPSFLVAGPDPRTCARKCSCLQSSTWPSIQERQQLCPGFPQGSGPGVLPKGWRKLEKVVQQRALLSGTARPFQMKGHEWRQTFHFGNFFFFFFEWSHHLRSVCGPPSKCWTHLHMTALTSGSSPPEVKKVVGRDCIVFCLTITGLWMQLNEEKRATAFLVTVAHLKSVVFKVVNPTQRVDENFPRQVGAWVGSSLPTQKWDRSSTSRSFPLLSMCPGMRPYSLWPLVLGPLKRQSKYWFWRSLLYCCI